MTEGELIAERAAELMADIEVGISARAGEVENRQRRHVEIIDEMAVGVCQLILHRIRPALDQRGLQRLVGGIEIALINGD